MSINIELGWAMAVFLLAVRLGILLVMSPIFSSLSAPVTIRVIFTLALSVMLVSGSRLQVAASALDIGPLFAAGLTEVVVGGALAFGVYAAFAAFAVAGKILDVQSGFGIGTVFDPINRSGAPIFSTLLNLLGVTAFFGLNAHHSLIRGIAYSLQTVPLGTGLPRIAPSAVLHQFGLMFSLGVALIAPVMFCLFLVEAALGVLARLLPQMNVFVVGMPAKIFTALAMLASTVSFMGPQMGRIYQSIFTYWEQVWM